MANRKTRRKATRQKRGAPISLAAADGPLSVRIIGGRLRGRQLAYHGQAHTRPMKDRTRQAVFDLLGPIDRAYAIDLFAGTGALGLEAISRGACGATLIERHFPTARLLRETAATLGVADQVEVVAADAFFWSRNPTVPAAAPWLVFCSPPYDLYVSRTAEMLALIRSLAESAPTGSRLVVESDERFSPDQLPEAARWNVRHYPPAIIALATKAEDW